MRSLVMEGPDGSNGDCRSAGRGGKCEYGDAPDV